MNSKVKSFSTHIWPSFTKKAQLIAAIQAIPHITALQACTLRLYVTKEPTWRFSAAYEKQHSAESLYSTKNPTKTIQNTIPSGVPAVGSEGLPEVLRISLLFKPSFVVESGILIAGETGRLVWDVLLSNLHATGGVQRGTKVIPSSSNCFR